MKLRPCIDLHDGKVKQIVGSTLKDESSDTLQTNFVADQPPSYFAEMYKMDGLTGGHIIMLGAGNEAAAINALAAWPGGMQIGGGINLENACYWLEKGASHVIVTSCVFKNGKIDHDYLSRLVALVGKEKLVLDLSCRKKEDTYYIVTDRWQNFTEVAITPEVLSDFSKSCAEFLVHAADVEGKCSGIEEQLVENLAKWTPLPTTYAGGIRDIGDIEKIETLGRGRLDATVGSALDIFGGTTITYRDMVAYHKSCAGKKMP